MSTPYQPSSPDDPGAREPRPTSDLPYGQGEAYGHRPSGQHDPYGQDPYSQQQTGYPGQGTEPYASGYGVYAGGYGAPTPDHPQGVLILVLGILGLVGVGILSPFAWVMGSRALRDIRATGQHPGNEQLIVIGRVLGIVGTVLLVLALVMVLVFLGLFAVAAVSGS